MKKSKILTLLLVLALLVGAIPMGASAASYPLVYADLVGTSITIPQGEVGAIKLVIFPEFKNEEYHVEIYNSSGRKIASAGNTYYNSSSMYRYVTISIDTDDLDMGVGTYTIKYWLSFYSMYSWHDAPNKYTRTIKVIKNTCKGNHNMVATGTSDATCSESDYVLMDCTKCEHQVYEEVYGEHTWGSWTTTGSSSHKRVCSSCDKEETASHSWNSGTVTKQPTCAATGIKTYTCTVCGGTKTETVAKTNDHSYGSWTKSSDSSHQRTCTRCGKAETASHSWNSGTVTTQPTCATTGIKTYTCTVCGGTKTETVAKTNDHSYGTGTKVDDQTHSHSCTRCGKTENVPHTWDAGTVLQEPTLEATGLRQRTCTDCGATKTEVMPKRSNGDLNDDGTVSTNDAVYLLLHIMFGAEDYPVPTGIELDMNKDGTLNTQDAVYLLLHVMFGAEDYPI